MRNQNRNIIINDLIERKEMKKLGLSAYDYAMQKIKEQEEYHKKIAKVHSEQLKKEKDGEFVEVSLGLQIFVRNGEDKEKRIEHFKRKLGKRL
jgi:hypothetical protein